MIISDKAPKAEQRVAFHAFMKTVAQELGPYTYEPEPEHSQHDWQSRGHLTHQQQAITLVASFNIDGYKASGKIEVRGIYARGPGNQPIIPPRLEAPSMAFTPDRPLRAIAADIRRRLVTPYIPYAVAVNEIAASQNDRQRKHDATRTALQNLGFRFRTESSFDGCTFGSMQPATVKVFGERADLTVQNLSPYVIGQVFQAIQAATAI